MKPLLLLLCLTLLFACSKPAPTPANQLVGTWRLSNYCKPVGTSGCTAVTVPDTKGVFVYFGNDGEFNETYDNTKPIAYSFLGCGGGRYKIEGDKIRINAVCMSSLEGSLMDIVSVSANRLVLNSSGGNEYVFVGQ